MPGNAERIPFPKFHLYTFFTDFKGNKSVNKTQSETCRALNWNSGLSLNYGKSCSVWAEKFVSLFSAMRRLIQLTKAKQEERREKNSLKLETNKHIHQK